MSLRNDARNDRAVIERIQAREAWVGRAPSSQEEQAMLGASDPMKLHIRDSVTRRQPRGLLHRRSWWLLSCCGAISGEPEE